MRYRRLERTRASRHCVNAIVRRRFLATGLRRRLVIIRRHRIDHVIQSETQDMTRMRAIAIDRTLNVDRFRRRRQGTIDCRHRRSRTVASRIRCDVDIRRRRHDTYRRENTTGVDHDHRLVSQVQGMIMIGTDQVRRQGRDIKCGRVRVELWIFNIFV